MAQTAQCWIRGCEQDGTWTYSHPTSLDPVLCDEHRAELRRWDGQGVCRECWALLPGDLAKALDWLTEGGRLDVSSLYDTLDNMLAEQERGEFWTSFNDTELADAALGRWADFPDYELLVQAVRHRRECERMLDADS